MADSPSRARNRRHCTFPLLAFIEKFSLILLVLSSSPGGGMAATTHTLSNGAALEVDVTSPTNSSCSGAVTSLSGFARVGQGAPSVSYIFIVDFSLSIKYNGQGQDSTGDVRERILNDTEMVFDQASTLNVGIIIFDLKTMSSNGGLLSTNKTAVMDYFSHVYTQPKSHTDCALALQDAQSMILDSPSVASTTLIIFAGDGTCGKNPSVWRQISQNLVATSLKKKETAVTIYVYEFGGSNACDNGTLTAIASRPELCKTYDKPSDFDIAKNVIGTTLKGIEYSFGSGTTKAVETAPMGDLPGPALKTFDMEISLDVPAPGKNSSSSIPGSRRMRNMLESRGLFANGPFGPQALCVTVTGSDTLSGQDQTVTECIMVSLVIPTPPTANCRPRKKRAQSQSAAASTGFFVLTGQDTCDGSLSCQIRDEGSKRVFGPYPVGTTMRYTKSSSRPPSAQKSGVNGIDYALVGSGNAYLIVTDASGNQKQALRDLSVFPKPSNNKMYGWKKKKMTWYGGSTDIFVARSGKKSKRQPYYGNRGYYNKGKKDYNRGGYYSRGMAMTSHYATMSYRGGKKLLRG